MTDMTPKINEDGSVTIGPEEARRMLSRLAGRPREPDPRRVEEYAEKMRSGLWRDAHMRGGSPPLMEDDLEGVVDGRMRLLAVLESGIEVDFVVMRGRFELFEPPEEN